MKTIFDLAIVGAGIIGANIAYQASQQHPGWRIVLIDRNLAGLGASTYSAGVDIPIARSKWHAQLTTTSRLLYQQHQHTLVNFPRIPLTTYCIATEAQLNSLKQKMVAGKLKILSNRSTNICSKKFGIQLQSDELLVAHSGNYYGLVKATVDVLIQHYVKHTNAFYYPGIDIAKIHYLTNNTIKLTTHDNIAIHTKRLISTIGPWHAPQTATLPALTRVKKVVALHIQQKPTVDAPLFFFFESGNFLLPRIDEGYWLFSFTSHEWGCNVKQQFTISAAEKTYASSFLQKYLPAFTDSLWSWRVFCDRYTSDRVPLIKPAEQKSNHLIIAGCSGSGYRLAPAIAVHALNQFNHEVDHVN
jgi:D-arginine dehydrogenase